MSTGRSGRQAVAELRWNSGADPVATVDGRSLHHYWSILSPYFRDTLLPPLRRPEGNAVAWRWLEPVPSRELTAAELRSMRKRLQNEQELLAENLSRAEAAEGAGGMRHRMNPRELAAAMGGVIDHLAGRDDATLAGFVAHTEAGLRLHSWGVEFPAPVRYPDAPPERSKSDAAAASGPTRTTSREARAGRRGWWWMVVGLGTMAGVGAVWTGSTRVSPSEERPDPAPQEARSMARSTVEGRADKAGTPGADNAAKINERRQVARLTPELEIAATAGQARLPQPGASTYFLNQSPAVKAKPLQTEERGKGRPPVARPDRSSGAAAGAKSGAMSDATSVAPAERVDGIENQHRTREEPLSPTGAATDGDVRRRAKTAAAAEQAVFPAESPIEDPLQDEGSSTLRKPKQADPTPEVAGPTPEATDPLPRMIDPETPRNASGPAGPTVLTIRIPHWRAQLLTDVILPTRPRRSGGPDEARALREQAAAEARARMPETLRAPQVRGGLGFEVGARETGQWRWQQPDGKLRPAAAENSSRAELGWDDLFPAQTWVLAHETLGPHAEAQREGNRVRVTVRGDVKIYEWSEVEIAPAESTARWNWQRADGAPLPPAANVRGPDSAGRTRIETPLGPSGAVAARVAFLDLESGWALIGEPGPDETARR